MDIRLKRAQVLYKDRQRIALSAVLVGFFVTAYVFYSLPILKISTGTPPTNPSGWAKGFEIVYSFNTLGFLLSLSILVFLYAFWTWAFLPVPAEVFTMAVLQGIFGNQAEIKKSFGKKFTVLFENGSFIEVQCRMKHFDEWFAYRLLSSPIDRLNLINIALRHGMHVENRRLITWASNEELHQRLILMTKALKTR